MSADKEPLLPTTKDNIQRLQQSNEKLDRCLRVINETETIGTNTLVELNEQEKTIINIRSKLDNDINPNINKSNSIIMGMLRRFYKNKYVTYATVFVCIAIIIMLLILIFMKFK
jgi:transcriptional regulator NrdR family protein